MVALLFCVFAALCGDVEAILYHRKGAESFQRNEHLDYTLQRVAAALCAVAAGLSVWWWHSLPWLGVELTAAAFLFPLCHDEAYNFARVWLMCAEAWYGHSNDAMLNLDLQAFRCARREYKFGYQSPTTTARFDFDGAKRNWLAVIGGLVWVAGFIHFVLR